MSSSPWYLNAALLAILATVVGWFVTGSLTRRREAESKRIEREAHYLERQIGEFYGPFFNLINQIVIMNHVQQNLLMEGRARLSPDDRARILQYFQSRYFFPLHEQVNQILKDKLYLVEGNSLPEVVYTYLRSMSQERVQPELWRDFGLDTSYLKGMPYPNDLYGTIKAGLDATMQRYSRYTEILYSRKSNDFGPTSAEAPEAEIMNDRAQSC